MMSDMEPTSEELAKIYRIEKRNTIILWTATAILCLAPTLWIGSCIYKGCRDNQVTTYNMDPNSQDSDDDQGGDNIVVNTPRQPASLTAKYKKELSKRLKVHRNTLALAEKNWHKLVSKKVLDDIDIDKRRRCDHPFNAPTAYAISKYVNQGKDIQGLSGFGNVSYTIYANVGEVQSQKIQSFKQSLAAIQRAVKNKTATYQDYYKAQMLQLEDDELFVIGKLKEPIFLGTYLGKIRRVRDFNSSSFKSGKLVGRVYWYSHHDGKFLCMGLLNVVNSRKVSFRYVFKKGNYVDKDLQKSTSGSQVLERDLIVNTMRAIVNGLRPID